MLSPLVAVAEAGNGTSNLATFVDKVNTVIVNPLIVLFFSLALALFLIGMLRFFFQKDQSSDAAKKGRQHMIWGIIGMFIMISVFGIMRLIINTLGADVTF